MIALAFIAGFVFGGLFGAAFVYIHEINILRGYAKRLEDVEKQYKSMINELFAELEKEESK